jgi:hypothetical protein
LINRSRGIFTKTIKLIKSTWRSQKTSLIDATKVQQIKLNLNIRHLIYRVWVLHVASTVGLQSTISLFVENKSSDSGSYHSIVEYPLDVDLLSRCCLTLWPDRRLVKRTLSKEPQNLWSLVLKVYTFTSRIVA